MVTHLQHDPGPTPDGPQPGTDVLDVSCLLDGELTGTERARVIERLMRDPQAQRLWSDLHVVGDAIRSSDVACMHRAHFQARLAACLAREPAIVAPHHHWVRRVVLPGAAIAAAAAMLIVVAVPQLRGGGADPSISVAATKPALSVGRDRGVAAASVAATRPINPYLHAHREFDSGGVLPPSAPYLRTSATLPMESGR